MENKIYKILVVGPTGAGKSQFCNFVLQDLTNKTFQVSDSMESCTKEPCSKISKRLETNLELIDTAGSSDSSNNDLINFQNLAKYLKEKKEIDYIILVLKFGERLTNETKEYFKSLSKLFTPNEFYFHLCVVFTKYPIHPTKKEERQKATFIKEINNTLKNSFDIEKNEILPYQKDIKVYFVDTEIIEGEEGLDNINDSRYEQRYQDTIDIMIKQIKLDVEICKSIKTENLEFDENLLKARKENEKKEIEILRKQLEEEKLRFEKEEKEKEKLKNELKKKKYTEKVKKKKKKDWKN